MHKSIATIDSPEFINLKPLDINPLMSECEIKVLYLGENRNRSYISEDAALEMAKTLRGAPIVGYYKPEKEDFADHGQRVILDDEGIKFECMTRPYGFVSPDAKVWFQSFEDTDDFGNKVVRKYLMTTGYLWTGQYEECQLATKEGRPHSMELDEDSLQGHWATNPDNGMEYFIINDAIFSKLCILGEDVEPCFEGSSVTAPAISSNFTKIDENFKQTLFTMMQELQFALKGGQQMENEVVTPVEDAVDTTETQSIEENTQVETEPSADTNSFVASIIEEGSIEEATNIQSEETIAIDSTNDVVDQTLTEEGNAETSDIPAVVSEETSVDTTPDAYTALEAQYGDLLNSYNELNAKYETLVAFQADITPKYEELVAFKAQIEDQRKDEMISKFYFLSDEDKKDVIENKSNYTIEEIESKLSVISVRNKVNFNLDNSNKNDIDTEAPITTYTIDSDEASVPAWVKAVKNNSKR